LTNYVKTITNRVNLFGPQPANKFASVATASNAVSFGSGYFGDTGQDLVVLFTKGISESIAISDSTAKLATIGIPNTLGITGTVGKRLDKWTSETVGITGTVEKRLDKYVLETLTLDSAVYKSVDHYISNSIVMSAYVGAVNKLVGSYAVMFPGGTSNLVSQVSFGYNSVSTSAGTWTTLAYTATAWS